MKAKYPFPNTTAAERRILDEIGAENCTLKGIFTRHLSKYIERFLAEGFIRQCGEKQICNDRFGKICIPQYEMETSWHIRWCDYHSRKHNEE